MVPNTVLVKIPNIEILLRQKEGGMDNLPPSPFVGGPDGPKINIKKINKEGKKGAIRKQASKQESNKISKHTLR